MIHFVISKDAKFIPAKSQVFMLDGRIKNYNLQESDHIWDHHCIGGRDCQMLEMPMPANKNLSILESYKIQENVTIVSPVYDADAIVAAAWLVLKTKYATKEVVQKLLAISLFCDHLIIPKKYQSLIKYSKFAAQNIASIYGVRDNFRTLFGFSEIESTLTSEEEVMLDSKAFQFMVKWYTDSIIHDKPWPSEAINFQRKHWSYVNKIKKQIIQNNLLTVIDEVVVYDARTVDTRDPRAAYAAISKLSLDKHLLFMTVWENSKSDTILTFWTNPNHPKWSKVYLTTFIQQFNLHTGTQSGARRTWGGSDYQVNITDKISIEKAAKMLSKYAQTL